ncbi:MAG: hypothetical protein EOO95_08580 [Pedobacter sp.]|nr:MAG: hypothetical protein EOO95_08580 [Pedobacter sp.]
MKKILLILVTAILFTMCGTGKKATAEAKAEAATRPEVQYKDDFRSVTDAEKAAFLKKMKATAANTSILIFTKTYKGEKVVASANGKNIFTGYLMSNNKTGIADKIRISNTVDTKIYDSFTKKEVIIEAAEAQKHKFIYLMKDTSGKQNPFVITYSNTLRPLE